MMKKLIILFLGIIPTLHRNEIIQAKNASADYIQAVHNFYTSAETVYFIKLVNTCIARKLSAEQSQVLLETKENSIIAALASYVEVTSLKAKCQKGLKRIESIKNAYMNLPKHLYEEALEKVKNPQEHFDIKNSTETMCTLLYYKHLELPWIKALEAKANQS